MLQSHRRAFLRPGHGGHGITAQVLLGLRFRLCGRRRLCRLLLPLLIPRKLRFTHRPELINPRRGMLIHLGSP
jgi:hypothetical protein